MPDLTEAAQAINTGCDRLRAVVKDPDVWSTVVVLSSIEQLRSEALTALGVETCPPLPPDHMKIPYRERWP